MAEILVLSPRFTDDSIALRRAALEQDWYVERLNSYRVPENLGNENCVIYGEALFSTIVADALNYSLLEAPANWLGQLPYDFLKRDIQFSSLEAARTTTFPRFIKPAEGKYFEAKVYKSVEELPPIGSQAEGMPVYIAEPVTWKTEFRCFVLEKKLSTFSIYARNGEFAESDAWHSTEDETKAVQSFFEVFAAAQVKMPPAFALDIGEIEGRGWAIIEANPAWAAGIYGCEPKKVLEVLKRSCIPSNDLSEIDAAWLIQRYSED